MILYLLILVILLTVFFVSPAKGILLTVITQPTISLFRAGGHDYSVDAVMAFVALIYLIINHRKYFSKRNSVCPFLIGLSFSFISYFISGLYNGQAKLPILLWMNCYDYILVLCLYYIYKPTKSNNKFLFSLIFIYSAILIIYGIQEAITAENPVIQYLYNIGMIRITQTDDYIRFGLYRAQSLTIWVSSFGTFCCFALVFLLLCAYKGIIKFNLRIYLLAPFLIVSVFLTGGRTIMVMTAIALMSLIPYFYKRPRYIIFFAVLVIAFIYNNPDYVSELADSFFNPDDAGGSSITGRQWQLLAALSYYYDSPIIGNGINFINEVQNQSSDILGAESIIYKTLVDRGNLGIITLVILYANIFYVLIKKKLYFLCFLPLAFAFGKTASLLPGQTEVYVLFWIIILLKLYDTQIPNGNDRYRKDLRQIYK